MAYGIVSKRLFDIYYVNPDAQVVIVGISPGSSQSFNDNYDATKGPRYNNQQCAFRDPKRCSIQNNLVRMLDSIGINKLLNFENESCSTLWNNNYDLINFTSLLPYSVLKGPALDDDSILDDDIFINENVKDKKLRFISGITIDDIKNSKLLSKDHSYFLNSLKQYKESTIFVACGPSVYDVLKTLVDFKRIIPIAHPSGANGECISIYLDNEEKIDISKREHAAKCMNARELRREANKIIHNLLQIK